MYAFYSVVKPQSLRPFLYSLMKFYWGKIKGELVDVMVNAHAMGPRKGWYFYSSFEERKNGDFNMSFSSGEFGGDVEVEIFFKNLNGEGKNFASECSDVNVMVKVFGCEVYFCGVAQDSDIKITLKNLTSDEKDRLKKTTLMALNVASGNAFQPLVDQLK